MDKYCLVKIVFSLKKSRFLLSGSFSTMSLHGHKFSNEQNGFAKVKHEACFLSTLWLFLDILHCFRGERESHLGIKSKLLQLGTELLGMTLATLMFVRRDVYWDFPLTDKWLLCFQTPQCGCCQRKVNSYIP